MNTKISALPKANGPSLIDSDVVPIVSGATTLQASLTALMEGLKNKTSLSASLTSTTISATNIQVTSLTATSITASSLVFSSTTSVELSVTGELQVSGSLTVTGAGNNTILSVGTGSTTFLTAISSGNIGIGTTTVPGNTLSVSGNAGITGTGISSSTIFTVGSGSTAHFVVGTSGNVGIGTLLNYRTLNISGFIDQGVGLVPEGILGSKNIFENDIVFYSNNVNSPRAIFWDRNTDNFGDIKLLVPSYALSFSTNTIADAMVIRNAGNVGINTTTPDNKLSVSGNTSVTGNFSVSGITQLKTGSSNVAVAGLSTLVSGIVTVLNSLVTANSFVWTNPQNGAASASINFGHVWCSSRTAAAGFTISSTTASDTRTIGWNIQEPF